MQPNISNTIRTFLALSVLTLVVGCNSDQDKASEFYGKYIAGKQGSDRSAFIIFSEGQVEGRRGKKRNAEYLFNDDGTVGVILVEGDDDVIVLRKNGIPDSWSTHKGGEVESDTFIVRSYD